MLEQRTTELEWMDGPDFGPPLVAGTFRFLEPVNRFLGGHRPMVAFFRRECRAWDRGQTYHLLDVGCGAGDVPLALARWARRAGYRVQVEGLDHNAATVDLARQKCRSYPEISLTCQDVFAWHGHVYDYVLASQFLHHFPDEQIPSVLRLLQGMSRCRVVINDLVRAPLAYLATWLFTLTTSAVFRHDGRISVRRGFTPFELERLLRGNGFPRFRLETHFFYRFQLVLEREQEAGSRRQEAGGRKQGNLEGSPSCAVCPLPLHAE
jgi:2-polyprenyl-3-methyl-5-hydroxy-6-metoxy-1,4-benzoquinol methylase